MIVLQSLEVSSNLQNFTQYAMVGLDWYDPIIVSCAPLVTLHAPVSVTEEATFCLQSQKRVQYTSNHIYQ